MSETVAVVAVAAADAAAAGTCSCTESCSSSDLRRLLASCHTALMTEHLLSTAAAVPLRTPLHGNPCVCALLHGAAAACTHPRDPAHRRTQRQKVHTNGLPFFLLLRLGEEH